jgi:hypothetical protein
LWPHTVHRPSTFVLPEGERPQPRLADWRSRGLHDAADYDVVGEHIEVVVVPAARGGEAD